MTQDLARIVHLFDRDVKRFPYQKVDEVFEFEGMAPKELYEGPEGPNFSAIHYHYGLEEGVGWNEKVDVLKNPEVLDRYNGEDLEFSFVTDMDILAARDGKIPKDSFYQLSAIGVTITYDDYVLLGVRGGDVNSKRFNRFASGMYGFPPGGSVSSKETGYVVDPITDTVIDEFKEEVGGDPQATGIRIDHVTPIGVFYANEPGPTGYKFVSLVMTNSTLNDIQRVNFSSNCMLGDEIERLTKEEGLDARSARKKGQKNLKEQGFPSDSWEHQPIIGLTNNPKFLREHLESQRALHCGISYGTMELYAQWLERQ